MKEEDIAFAYKYYLGREVDPEGLALYRGMDYSLTRLEYDLFNSDEYKKNGKILMYPQTTICRKICILPEAKFVFVPIAKNAHTSITEACLRFKGIDWKTLPIFDELVEEYGDEDHRFHSAIEDNDLGILLKHFPPRLIHEALTSPEYLKVSVIRDPLERIVSSYKYLLVKTAGNPVGRRYTDPILKFLNKKDGDHISFPEFILYISSFKDSELDPHFAPQYTFISGLNIDKLIPIDKVSVLESIVEERSGKPFFINHLNTNVRSAGKTQIVIDDSIKKFVEDRYWLDKKLYNEAVENYKE